MSLLFWVSLLTLLLVPLLALIIYRLGKRLNKLRRNNLIYSALGYLALVGIAAGLTKISFQEQWLNFLSLSIGYLTYCYIVVCLQEVRPVALRLATVLVGVVPISLGYVLATIGILGLAFIVGDYEGGKTELVGPDLVCRTTEWGNALSDHGYRLGLYRFWHGFPVLEREVYFENIAGVPHVPATACNEAKMQYSSMRASSLPTK